MGTVAHNQPLEQLLPATLTEVAFGPGVDVVFVNSDVDMYVVAGGYGTGNAVPTGVRYRVPANICHPLRRKDGVKLWVAAMTTTGTMWAWAHPPVSSSPPSSSGMDCP